MDGQMPCWSLTFPEPRPLTLSPPDSLTQTPPPPSPGPAHLGIQVEEAVVLKAQPEHVPGLDPLLHEAPRGVQPPAPQHGQGSGLRRLRGWGGAGVWAGGLIRGKHTYKKGLETGRMDLGQGYRGGRGPWQWEPRPKGTGRRAADPAGGAPAVELGLVQQAAGPRQALEQEGVRRGLWPAQHVIAGLGLGAV